MSKIFIEESSLTAIGDAIRSKTGGTDLLSPAGMVGAIESISAGSELPVQLLTDSLDSVFKNNRFNTLVEAGCFETKNITALSSFCDRSTTLKKIDFDINCAENSVTYCYSMLKDCYKLEEIPKFVNLNPYNLNNSFYNCMYLIEIPEEKFVNFSRHSSASDLSMYRTFYHCYSLRKMPYIAKIYYDNATKTSSNVYEEAFCGCASLDEIVDLSVCLSTDTPITGSYGFWQTFAACYRCKNMTFKMIDGAPQVASWKGQSINLYPMGYGLSSSLLINTLNPNNGITADKEVKDDATYQALKDDPDWWTSDAAYSRYNHDSAVNTINSLPDTSAYLAEAGGTNTINFKGEAGSATDGGAINTLTEAEIAVAAAKGWTVSLA